MRTDTGTRDLRSADLRRLVGEARAIIESPDPSVEAFARYGVHDVASLALWVKAMEEELRRRSRTPES